MKMTYPKWALSMTAMTLLVLAVCFAAGQTSFRPLARLPAVSPAVTQAPEDGLVDINTATLEELMTLPAIGETRAQAILDDRAANGPFRYPEDLIRVSGIGEGILANVLDKIKAGGEDHATDSGG